MSLARYAGVGLRLLARLFLAMGTAYLGAALIWGLIAAFSEGAGTEGKWAFVFIGMGLALIVMTVFLCRQWRWLARRLLRGHPAGVLRRAPVRAAMMGGLAALGAYRLIVAVAMRVRDETPMDEFPGERQALVYLAVGYGAVIAIAIRSAIAGTHARGSKRLDQAILTPRALESAGAFALGAWLLSGIAVACVQVGAAAFDDAGNFVEYFFSFIVVAGLLGTMGIVYVRSSWKTRHVLHPPLRLTCAGVGLAVLLQIIERGAQWLGETLHGPVRPGFASSASGAESWSVFDSLLYGNSGPALLLAFLIALGFLAYARFGKSEEHIHKVFE